MDFLKITLRKAVFLGIIEKMRLIAVCREMPSRQSDLQSHDTPPQYDLCPLLLKILVCPLTRQPLHYNPIGQEFISNAAGLAYPVRDGVPILLAEEARALSPEEAQKSDLETGMLRSDDHGENEGDKTTHHVRQ